MPEVQNQFAPWRVPVLVPLWIIQIVLGLVFLVAVPIIANENRQYYSSSGMDARYVVLFVCLAVLDSSLI